MNQKDETPPKLAFNSGDTVAAARLLNKKCIEIEANEKFCKVAARRLQETEEKGKQ